MKLFNSFKENKQLINQTEFVNVLSKPTGLVYHHDAVVYITAAQVRRISSHRRCA